MKQTIVVKLEPTPEQANALRLTMEVFNRGCDSVAEAAFQKRLANTIAIQPFGYGTLRSEFGLSSQMSIRAIAKAIEGYKRDKSIQPAFDPHGAMVYDHHILSFRDLSHVSLLILTGRELIPRATGTYQQARMDRINLAKSLVRNRLNPPRERLTQLYPRSCPLIQGREFSRSRIGHLLHGF